ncbi:hypothetical protein [Halobacterium noricense]|uniref:hypothetical protein n=1 Tax=Halobacterium noricense TaxID=223182 RepID=UPI001E38D24A|nr:hypothetical protein [Halobacterium noricense]UHH25612.1 hypothetical protein LT974_01410 [Halobacterium noricense]
MKNPDLRDFTVEELAAELAERHCDHDSGDNRYISIEVNMDGKFVASYAIQQTCVVDEEFVYPESARPTTDGFEEDESDAE